MERKCVILVILGSERVTVYDLQNCHDDGNYVMQRYIRYITLQLEIRYMVQPMEHRVDSRNLHSRYQVLFL